MPAGRPLLYKTPEEMQVVIDQYFEENTWENKETGQIICQPTMSGLAFALNMSRQSLCNYSHKDEFFDTIKKARNKVECALERHLYGTTVTGVIFNLKNNFDWKDKSEIDSHNRVEIVEIKDDFGED